MLYNITLIYIISAVLCLMIAIQDCIKTKDSLWISDLFGIIVVSICPVVNTLIICDFAAPYIFKDRCLFKRKK